MVEQSGGRSTALILAGAVAKGAFEAGVISVLAERREELAIRRVVGASSGALNGAIYAAGIRAGREQDAAERLDQLWRERGGWHDIFKFSLSDAIHLRGAGTAKEVCALMDKAVEGWVFDRRRHIDLRIVVTGLRGELGKIGDHDATTYEHVAKFGDQDFETATGWERICRTAAGSASFPVIFAPADVPGVGPSLDGGIVNNTPIKWAIEGGIERVIVVSPHPEVLAEPKTFGGADLVGEFVDILINERLYRDLHEAASVNERLARIDGMVRAGRLTPAGADAVRETFGWHTLEIIQIRPKTPLEGTAFTAFGNADLRSAYLRQGRERAVEILGR
jgi:NTE family protein